MGDLRPACLQIARQCRVVETRMGGGRHIGACPRALGEMLDFGDAVRRQGIDRDQSGAEQAHHHGDEIGDVRQMHQHAVALAQARTQETRRQRAGAAVQFGIGPALCAADDGQPVGMGRGAVAQPGTEGFVAPVASRPVARGEIIRPYLDGAGRCGALVGRTGGVGSSGGHRHGSGISRLSMIMRMIIV